MESFKIRKATNKDGETLAPLIYRAYKDFAHFICLSDDYKTILERLALYFNHHLELMLNYRNFSVIEESNTEEVVGIVGSLENDEIPFFHNNLRSIIADEIEDDEDLKEDTLLKLAVLREASEHEYYLDVIAVAHAYEGRGIADKLIAIAEKKGELAGYEELTLLTADELKAFYEKKGFIFKEMRGVEGGAQYNVMSKPIISHLLDNFPQQKHKHSFRVRGATTKEGEYAAPLILSAERDFANFICLSDDRATILERLAFYFDHHIDTMINYRHYSFIEDTTTGALAGIIGSVGGDEIPILYNNLRSIMLDIEADEEEKEATLLKLAVLREAWQEEYYLDILAIHSAYRGLGLADVLIEVASQKGELAGYPELNLLTIDELMDFYNRKGFVLREKRVVDEDISYNVMFRPIKSQFFSDRP